MSADLDKIMERFDKLDAVIKTISTHQPTDKEIQIKYIDEELNKIYNYINLLELQNDPDNTITTTYYKRIQDLKKQKKQLIGLPVMGGGSRKRRNRRHRKTRYASR